MANINYDYITEYIRNTIAPNNALLQELEEYAEVNRVPIIQPEAAKMLYVLGKIANPKNVLEVGAAIGYSAILMSGFLQKDGQITTIERDAKMIAEAKKNIEKADLTNTIKILEGDALEILPSLNDEFDLIFIDAGKGHYQEFFEHAARMIKAGGVIISDNILFRGMIADDELVDKRNRTIVKRMRDFLSNICSDRHFETSIIPIGDGIALTIKSN